MWTESSRDRPNIVNLQALGDSDPTCNLTSDFHSNSINCTGNYIYLEFSPLKFNTRGEYDVYIYLAIFSETMGYELLKFDIDLINEPLETLYPNL